MSSLTTVSLLWEDVCEGKVAVVLGMDGDTGRYRGAMVALLDSGLACMPAGWRVEESEV